MSAIAQFHNFLRKSVQHHYRTSSKSQPPHLAQYGVIEIESESQHHPLRVYNQVGIFPSNSPASELFAAVKNNAKITLMLPLNLEKYATPFAIFQRLVLKVRGLSSDGRLRNDWYLSRFTEYDEASTNPWQNYQHDRNLRLPQPPWIKPGEQLYSIGNDSRSLESCSLPPGRT